MALRELLVRQPQQPPVQASPIVGPRPSYFGEPSLQPQHPMPARELWGFVFWGLLGAFILTTEALAAWWDGFPIPTISWTTGQLEQHHHWFKLIVVGGIVLISARITFYPWPFRRLDD
jgi:hypothetical protein